MVRASNVFEIKNVNKTKFTLYKIRNFFNFYENIRQNKTMERFWNTEKMQLDGPFIKLEWVKSEFHVTKSIIL